jgi:hypothetical protein
MPKIKGEKRTDDAKDDNDDDESTQTHVCSVSD